MYIRSPAAMCEQLTKLQHQTVRRGGLSDVKLSHNFNGGGGGVGERMMKDGEKQHTDGVNVLSFFKQKST